MMKTMRAFMAISVLLFVLFSVAFVSLQKTSIVQAASGTLNVGNSSGTVNYSGNAIFQGADAAGGTGTIACSNGSATVTGTNTSFTTEVIVGDWIKCSTQRKAVTSVQSNTSLTVTSAFTVAASGQSNYIMHPIARFKDYTGATKYIVDPGGNFGAPGANFDVGNSGVLTEGGTALSSKYAYIGGGNATGTWGISISGNAATATNALQWDGGSTNLTAATGRTSLGLGTVATLNSIDISSNTNLAVTSPVTLTGDTVGVNASSANTINYLVQRDGSGNFSAGTITAALSGNATTATTATTANAVSFNGGLTTGASPTFAGLTVNGTTDMNGAQIFRQRGAMEGTGASCSAVSDGSAGWWYADDTACSEAFAGISSTTHASASWGVYFANGTPSAGWKWIIDLAGNESVTGDINTSGNLKTGGTARISSTGALSNITTIGASGLISTSANGQAYFCGGDDACLYDVNVAGIVGIQGTGGNSGVGGLKLGSSGQTLYGTSTGVGIGITAPNGAFSVVTTSVSRFTDNTTTDGVGTNPLRLNLGTAVTGTSSRFIRMYAGVSSTDNGGTGVGYIKLNNSAVALGSGSADFAEYFQALEEGMKAGEVMAMVDGKVRRATSPSDTIVGVISDHAIVIGNSPPNDENPDFDKGYVIVGLRGQVRTYLSTSNGPIKSGDPLMASNVPGVAVKATKAGMIIGNAIEDYTNSDPNHYERKNIIVNVSWYDPGTDTQKIESQQRQINDLQTQIDELKKEIQQIKKKVK